MLNPGERWLALLTEKQLPRGVHQSSGELDAAIDRYLDTSNDGPKPIVWTGTADQILANVARFCQGTFDARHQEMFRNVVAAAGVDISDCERFAPKHCGFADGYGAGQEVQEADLDGVGLGSGGRTVCWVDDD